MQKSMRYWLVAAVAGWLMGCDQGTEDGANTVATDAGTDTATETAVATSTSTGRGGLWAGECGETPCDRAPSTDAAEYSPGYFTCCTTDNQCGYKVMRGGLLKDYAPGACIDYTFRGGELSTECPDSPVFFDTSADYQQYKGCVTAEGTCGYWFDVIHFRGTVEDPPVSYLYDIGCIDAKEFVEP